MYAQYRCVDGRAVPAAARRDATPAEGASCFVNPLTALGMVETMRREGHTRARAHRRGVEPRPDAEPDLPRRRHRPRQHRAQARAGGAAARARRDATSATPASPTFIDDLTEALAATGATIAFDAIGGGRWPGRSSSCMEAAVNRSAKEYSRYGSTIAQAGLHLRRPRHRARPSSRATSAWPGASAAGCCSRSCRRSAPPAAQQLRAARRGRAEDDLREPLRARDLAGRGAAAGRDRDLQPARDRREVPARAEPRPVLNGAPMSYMLLIVEPVGQRRERSEAEGHRVYEQMLRFADELKARGVLRASESLASDARRRAGARRPHGHRRRPVRRGEGDGRRLLPARCDDRGRGAGDRRAMPGGRMVQRRGPRDRRPATRDAARSARRAFLAPARAGLSIRASRRSSYRQEPGVAAPARNDKEHAMRFMIIVKATPDSEAGVMPDETPDGRDGRLPRGAGQGRRAARRQRACSRARKGWRIHYGGRPAPRRRRAVRRDQGTDRRLHADPGALARRGDGMDAPLPGAVDGASPARSRCASCTSSTTSRPASRSSAFANSTGRATHARHTGDAMHKQIYVNLPVKDLQRSRPSSKAWASTSTRSSPTSRAPAW